MNPIDQFPFSNQAGADMSGINTFLVQQIAAQAPALDPAILDKKLTAHHLFLSTGGAGGYWKTLLLKGMVFGIYNGPESKSGEQASFEHQHLSENISFIKIELPFSNFCAVYAPQIDFTKANLSHCLLTDAFLRGANFSNARLCKSDFSRANLSKASFVNTDCTGVDFENCNLQGADFTNACLRGARFPGADLEGVKY